VLSWTSCCAGGCSCCAACWLLEASAATTCWVVVQAGNEIFWQKLLLLLIQAPCILLLGSLSALFVQVCIPLHSSNHAEHWPQARLALLVHGVGYALPMTLWCLQLLQPSCCCCWHGCITQYSSTAVCRGSTLALVLDSAGHGPFVKMASQPYCIR